MGTAKKKALYATALVVALLASAWLLTRPSAPDVRYNGAYRLDDGRLVFVTPREGRVLRFRTMAGESRALWPSPAGGYEAGPGWAQREPTEVRLRFQTDDARQPRGFQWTHPAGGSQRARRLELPERNVRFASGGLSLRGKLVAPGDGGPHPAVVLVHGSGKESAVDTYYEPYLFASHGVSTFVFDKRGTGHSEGSYNQNFSVLADDVVAAVEWLRRQPEIDPERIHLAGYSQGGWIAPLAASRTPPIRSLLIAYGPMVPITAEDRWGYVYALEERGFGEREIGAADQINDALSAIFDRGEDRWSEVRGLLDEARGEPWLQAVRGSDSMLGFVADTALPWWVLRAWVWWMRRPQEIPFVDRTYDPVPVAASLEVPSLWIFGGRDHSMPTGWTVEELERLRGAGRPIRIEVFPTADHGILRFEESTEGERTVLGYAPGYLPLQVAWLRQQSGLGATAPG